MGNTQKLYYSQLATYLFDAYMTYHLRGQAAISGGDTSEYMRCSDIAQELLADYHKMCHNYVEVKNAE